MEQKVIDALILRIKEIYPEYKVYDVKMEMDVDPPMFMVNCYQCQIIDRIRAGGFFYAMDFEIIFFPGNDEPEEQIREVELDIMNCLWRFGDGYRADKRNARVIDGVLHIFFSVTANLKPVIVKPVIKEIHTKIEGRDGKQIQSGTIETGS